MNGGIAHPDDGHIVDINGGASLHGHPAVGSATGSVHAHVHSGSAEKRLAFDHAVGRTSHRRPGDRVWASITSMRIRWIERDVIRATGIGHRGSAGTDTG
jgi:hypothetical protein